MGKKNKTREKIKQRGLSIDFDELYREEDGFIRMVPTLQSRYTNWISTRFKKRPEAPIKVKKKNVLAKELEERLKSRKIPLVDEGIRVGDLSKESLANFYRTAHVSEFVRIEGDRYIRFEFGKALDGYRTNVDDNGENSVIRMLSCAEITKKSFINSLALSVRYINYFIEYFDDDDELMRAYLELMIQIHSPRVTLDVASFIDAIYASIATESMIHKVIRMVEHNIDPKNIKKSDQTFDESIQITPEHYSAIMGISCFHKFIIPIVSHYYTIRKAQVDASGMSYMDLYYYVLRSFVPIFDDYYGINLYGKLYHTATTRISKTENREKVMWDRRYRFGTTPISFAHNLIKDYLTEISQKAIFSMSAIVFLNACFDKAVKNELIQSDKNEMTDMKMESSDNVNETFSRFDKWQTDKTAHSEKERLSAHVAIKDMIYRLGMSVNIDFRLMDQLAGKETVPKSIQKLRKEFAYYQDNIQQPLDDTQMFILQMYFAKKLHCIDDVKMTDMSDLIRLIMCMKRDLRARNYIYIPLFISSTIRTATFTTHKNSGGTIKKSLMKQFEQHPIYDDWKSEYPDTFKLINMQNLASHMQTLATCPISIVDYDTKKYTDKQITPMESMVIDEWASLLAEC